MWTSMKRPTRSGSGEKNRTPEPIRNVSRRNKCEKGGIFKELEREGALARAGLPRESMDILKGKKNAL